jgi:hypothetical protein
VPFICSRLLTDGLYLVGTSYYGLHVSSGADTGLFLRGGGGAAEELGHLQARQFP